MFLKRLSFNILIKLTSLLVSILLINKLNLVIINQALAVKGSNDSFSISQLSTQNQRKRSVQSQNELISRINAGW